MPEDKDSKSPTRSTTWKDLKHVRSNQFEIVYANFGQCGYTPWDIRITFSDVSEAEVDVPAIVDLKTITLPPQVAKALVAVLLQNVRNYESDFGPIKLPPHLADKQAEVGAQAEGQAVSEEKLKTASAEGDATLPE
jgi:Protein of unknown function (DUF3467)